MKLKSAIVFIVAVTLFLAASPHMNAPVQAAPRQATCTTYHEAPQLAADVAAGKLPPVQQRLPKDPVVDTPAEKVGMYGGSMLDLYDGIRLAEFRQFGYENLVLWSPDVSKVIPNIEESWDINKNSA